MVFREPIKRQWLGLEGSLHCSLTQRRGHRGAALRITCLPQSPVVEVWYLPCIELLTHTPAP